MNSFLCMYENVVYKNFNRERERERTYLIYSLAPYLVRVHTENTNLPDDISILCLSSSSLRIFSSNSFLTVSYKSSLSL